MRGVHPSLLLPACLLLAWPCLASADDVIPGDRAARRPHHAHVPDFSIVYEGATGGISGASADLWADPLVAAGLAQDGKRTWARLAGGWGAFLQDGRWLIQNSGGVGRFQETVAPSVEPSGEPVTAQVLLGSEYAVFVWPPAAEAEILPGLQQALSADPLRPPPQVVPFRAIPCQVADGDEVLLVMRTSDRRPLERPLDPLTWEARVHSVFEAQSSDPSGGPVRVHVVSRVEGEGSRRAALIARWREAPSIYVSAGESIEGRSFLPGRNLSLQRPLTWKAWKELGLAALAPGEAELLAGLGDLKAEAGTAGVALVSINLLDTAGQPVFEPWVIREVEGRTVALVGWTDPRVLPRLPPDVRVRLKVRGMAAVLAMLAGLSDSQPRPDLVVLFGVGAREVAGDVPGVDVVLGDFATRLRLARWEEIDGGSLRARSEDHPRSRAPALVTRLGGRMVGRVDVSFDGPGLSGLRHLRARVGEDHPPDLVRVRQIQEVRQPACAGMEDVLVPDLARLTPQPGRGRPAPPAAMDAGAFAQLAANLLMDRTGSDLALLRPLPDPGVVPGDTLSLYVDASLAVPDQVVVAELTGVQLAALLKLVEPVIPRPGLPGWGAPQSQTWAWSAGVVSAGAGYMVRGRVVLPTELVRVATTDFFADNPAVAALLAAARTWRAFDGVGWTRTPVALVPGHAWRLDALVRSGLIDLRSESPGFGERYAGRLRPLLIDQSAQRSGRFTLELDALSATVTGSVGAGERMGYEQARETRIHQPDSLSTALRGRVAAVWEDRVGSATFYGLGAFGRSHLPDVPDPIEVEDNLEFGAQGSLRMAQIPAEKAKIPLSTFVHSAFDTELTAQVDGLGGELPLQRVLRTTGGLMLGRYLEGKDARAGLFVEYDFAATLGPLAPGINLALSSERSLPPFRWSALVDLKAYFGTPDDQPEDLALLLQARAEIGVQPLRKLFPGLAVGGFADALLFRGKLDSNDQPGAHLLLGASLTYDADLRVARRLR